MRSGRTANNGCDRALGGGWSACYQKQFFAEAHMPPAHGDLDYCQYHGHAVFDGMISTEESLIESEREMVRIEFSLLYEVGLAETSQEGKVSRGKSPRVEYERRETIL